MIVSASPHTGQQRWIDDAIEAFATQTPGVIQAVAVSVDGLLLARSTRLDRDDSDRFAAITSAMTSLAIGAARSFELGSMNKLVIDLELAFLLLSAFGPTAWLGVMAERKADLGDLARRVADFVGQAADFAIPADAGESGYWS
jgi:predicted regulator of Ras-like GTPase activity (Roadblock/LC7/MglB family)